ncbi:Hsp33 family molecular chaperone HslO [Eubacteriales bacterium OttesenSCG-928-M02]|nr:Hsp33 family molecular chaperone HslO [Eubacteriales bacterium OttesenSCG-928-M02]
MDKMGTMIRTILEDGQASCILIDGTEIVKEAQGIHGLSPVATAALGRALMGAILMAADLKEMGGDITLSIAGDGPLGKILVIADNEGNARGRVDNPHLALPLTAEGKLDVGGAVGRDGTLTVVRDVGFREPYQGRVSLYTGEIAEDIAYYYATSQQQPCLWYLGVHLDRDGSVLSAGGLSISPLPGCSEEALRKIELGVPLYSDLANMLVDNTLAQCLPIVLHGLAYKVLEESPVAYRCNCTRERMERALISLGAAELESMIEEDKGAELSCQFCNRTYQFSEEDLTGLLAEATEKP